MKKIIEAGDLPENEKLYLKKDFLGYRIVHPIKNEDGSINWMNLLFGGKKNGLLLILLIILFLLYYNGMNDLVGSYKKVAQNPCSFCNDCQVHTRQIIATMNNKNFGNWGDLNGSAIFINP